MTDHDACCEDCGKPILTQDDEPEFGCNWEDYSRDKQYPTRCWSCAEARRGEGPAVSCDQCGATTPNSQVVVLDNDMIVCRRCAD